MKIKRIRWDAQVYFGTTFGSIEKVRVFEYTKFCYSSNNISFELTVYLGQKHLMKCKTEKECRKKAQELFNRFVRSCVEVK